MKQRSVYFLDIKCDIVKLRYPNSRTALELVIAENDEERELYKGEPMATATVNIPQVPLERNEVIIKDYSENEGMLETLVKAGIVEDTGKVVETGFVVCNICKLLI